MAECAQARLVGSGTGREGHAGPRKALHQSAGPRAGSQGRQKARGVSCPAPGLAEPPPPAAPGASAEVSARSCPNGPVPVLSTGCSL